MIDEEIEKGLECCKTIPCSDCENCPYEQFDCKQGLLEDSHNYINRLRAQNEFAHSESANAIQRYFEVAAEKRGLQNKIAELEIEKEREIARARLDMAKTIFKEMYELVSANSEETIIINAKDVKAIAKRYGVEVAK